MYKRQQQHFGFAWELHQADWLDHFGEVLPHAETVVHRLQGCVGFVMITVGGSKMKYFWMALRIFVLILLAGGLFIGFVTGYFQYLLR